MDARPTDVLLVRCSLASPDGLADAARRLVANAGWPATLQRAAWSAPAQLAYVYLQLTREQAIPAGALADLAAQWRTLCPQAEAIDVARLQRALDLAGVSAGATPRNHYTVETDPREGWADEIERWYAVEHLPGLAAVPGCILAQRYLNHDSGPRSLACYDLVAAEVLTTPAWLTVRETEWSDRARPHFTNTRRTMMEVVG
ncbi:MULTISPECIES: hypothetical protein [Ramlibacter]|uniref:Uncharacterized protein n=1 Tax=Ramlibacter pinisoli TaxID=2682844 RepID=A0A6N8IR35_9BURK|nr:MULTISPECIES: hypothetical protein [Ramlibacter]MBA2964385.1 hypothetical protein [Ramlibacter sp. CGMCC 1.13660]MVQ29351.1 hypothetical protein [Ramlibacter pinisoli]